MQKQNILLIIVLLQYFTQESIGDSFPEPGSNQRLYPYGSDFGDTKLLANQNGVSLGKTVKLIGQNFQTTNLEKGGAVLPHNQNGDLYILNFYFTSSLTSGYAAYRSDTTSEILTRATKDVVDSFPEFPNFVADWTFIDTCHECSYPNGVLATFQTIIVSNAQNDLTFVILNYGDDITGPPEYEVSLQDSIRFNSYSISSSKDFTFFKNNLKNRSIIFRVDSPTFTPQRYTSSCNIGTFSTNGFKPCTLCPIGQYQESETQTQCSDCPSGLTTRAPGSNSAADCFNPASAVGDPHFMITNPTDQQHLCFDIQGDNGDVLQLVKNKELDLVVNGKLFSVETTQHFNQTYFAQIILHYSNLRITFDKHYIAVSNHKEVFWSKDDVTDLGDVILKPVTSYDDVIQIDFPKLSVSFVVKRRDAGFGYFLGFFLQHTAGLTTSTTTGLIGQFLNREFYVAEDAGNHMCHITLNDNRHLSLPVKQKPRFNAAKGEMVDCWLYRPQAGTTNLLL